jgi:uncharacterized membrane protein YbhN (UPF0104 family)
VARRGKLIVAAQVVLAIVVVWVVADRLGGQWAAVENRIAGLQPRWGAIGAACALVLLTYGLLVETWRAVVGGWGAHLRYWDAAAIWSISNLGRYVPGKVWQLGTMAVMAQQHGVSGVVAAGSALVVTVVNLVAGFVVAAATGANVLGVSRLGVATIAIATAGVFFAPWVLPSLARVAARVTGRDVTLPPLRRGPIWLAAVASCVAWVLYGLAFRLLAVGVLGTAPGAPSLYIAVFTGSYLIGFLTLFSPGGLGTRELAMAAALAKAGLDVGSATILVVTSRLWLTVLEITPAVLFLAYRAVRPNRRDASNTATP